MYKAFYAGHIGFSKTFEEDVETAVKFGYEGVHIDIVGLSDRDPAEIREILAKNNLKPGGFVLPVNYREGQDVFEADMQKLPIYCEFAREIGDFRCMTWLIPWSDTLTYEENFELHRSRLTPIAKVLEDYGIRFGIEFVGPPGERKGKKYEFIHNLDGLIRLWDAIGTSNLGVIIDVWHWDLAGQTYDDFKKIPGKEWVVIAHINDMPKGIALEDQQDLSRELPGATGLLRIDEFFDGLLKLGYDGPVYAEPFYAPLKEMPYDEAVKVVTDAINKVWPL